LTAFDGGRRSGLLEIATAAKFTACQAEQAQWPGGGAPSRAAKPACEARHTLPEPTGIKSMLRRFIHFRSGDHRNVSQTVA
jgi:hypothetical protein